VLHIWTFFEPILASPVATAMPHSFQLAQARDQMTI